MAQTTQKPNTIIDELRDYMFTSKNIDRYTKHIIKINDRDNFLPKTCFKNINDNNNDLQNNKLS